MEIVCRAEALFACTPARAFALVTDAARFPAFFRGFGPIPAVREIVLETPPLAVGARRSVRNGDGSVLAEVVTAFDPPRRHDYRLDGFRAPMSWLVRHGEAAWTLTDAPDGCRVRWTYRFVLTHPLAWPLAAALLHGCMAPAMRRCLRAMAQATASGAPATEGAR